MKLLNSLFFNDKRPEFSNLPFGMRTVTLGSAAFSFLQATFCNATRSKSCNKRR